MALLEKEGWTRRPPLVPSNLTHSLMYQAILGHNTVQQNHLLYKGEPTQVFRGAITLHHSPLGHPAAGCQNGHLSICSSLKADYLVPEKMDLS